MGEIIANNLIAVGIIVAGILAAAWLLIAVRAGTINEREE